MSKRSRRIKARKRIEKLTKSALWKKTYIKTLGLERIAYGATSLVAHRRAINAARLAVGMGKPHWSPRFVEYYFDQMYEAETGK